jgi:phage-related protein (TIGR01555 family)
MADDPKTAVPANASRNERGQFPKGVSGNPGGKRKEQKERNDARLQRLDEVAHEEPRRDGWMSALTGIGTDARDKRRSHSFTSAPLSYATIASLWDQNDVTAKAIELPSQECFSEGYEIEIPGEGDYKDLKEELEDFVTGVELDYALEEVWQYKRAFGGGAALIGADDNLTLDKPLDPTRVRSVEYINVFEPLELEPVKLYSDPASKNYGKPEFFRLVPLEDTGASYGQAKKARPPKKGSNIVHESRLLVFRGIRASRYYVPTSEISPYWGASVIPRFYEILRDHGVAYSGAGLLATDVSQPIIAIDGLKEMVGKNEEKLRARAAAIEMSRSIARAILIDANKERYERQTTQLSGIPELLDRLDKRLSAAIGFPLSILLNYDPVSLGKPDTGEFQQWHKIIRALQRREMTPRIKRVLNLGMRTMRQRKIPKKIELCWRDLMPLTAPQQAELELTQARTDTLQVKNGAIYPEEIRKSRWKGGWSQRTQIDEKKKAPGFMAPLPAGVLPGSTPAVAGAKPGAPAPQGPNAHAVSGYARRNPTQTAANPKVGGDTAPAEREDGVNISQLEREREEAAARGDDARVFEIDTLLDRLANEGRQAAVALQRQRQQHKDEAARVEFAGFNICIENPKGSVRQWTDSDGTTGSTKMRYDYGYIDGSLAQDGEPVDVYLGPSPDAQWVYVVHQMSKASDFTMPDEDKVMLGFDSANHALDAYLNQYDDERFFGGMSIMGIEDFRRMVSGMTGARIAHGQLDESAIVEHLDRIEQRDGKWVVMSQDGTKTLGEYDSEEEAIKRLAQVEHFKSVRDALARGIV